MVIEVKRNQFIIAENEFLKISFLMGAAYQRASAQVAASMDLDRRSYSAIRVFGPISQSKN